VADLLAQSLSPRKIASMLRLGEERCAEFSRPPAAMGRDRFEFPQFLLMLIMVIPNMRLPIVLDKRRIRHQKKVSVSCRSPSIVWETRT